jgi:hypothetical protein
LFPVQTPTWKVMLQQPEDIAESCVISYEEKGKFNASLNEQRKERVAVHSRHAVSANVLCTSHFRA